MSTKSNRMSQQDALQFSEFTRSILSFERIEAFQELPDEVLLDLILKERQTGTLFEMREGFTSVKSLLDRIIDMVDQKIGPTFLGPELNKAEERRKDLIWGKKVIRSKEFTYALGITRQALSKAVQARRIFALEHHGENFYPAFYLDPEIDRKKVEQVAKALGDIAGWEKWLFFTQPKISLGKITPLDALKKGKYQQVLKAAAGFKER